MDEKGTLGLIRWLIEGWQPGNMGAHEKCAQVTMENLISSWLEIHFDNVNKPGDQNSRTAGRNSFLLQL